jgi:ABC-type antimicrobial peptide transport system permease subunit
MGYLVEVAAEPEGFLPRFREIAAEVDPEAMTEGFALADGMRRESRVLRGLFTGMVLIAAVAFLLAVTGLYALMSFTVSQRTREIGIRVALGASPGAVRRQVVRSGLLHALGGVIAGAALATAVLQVVIARVPGIQPADAPLLGGVAGAMVLGAAAVTWLPARRATAIHPVEALRSGG